MLNAAKMRTKTADTAIREINPACATKVRPMLSPLVKQTILVPWELLNRACSSAVQMLPSNMVASLCLVFNIHDSGCSGQFDEDATTQVRVDSKCVSDDDWTECGAAFLKAAARQ